MKKTIYLYDSKEYFSEHAVRQAIFEKERLAFGTPATAEEWEKLGVTYTEEEIVVSIEELKKQKTEEIKQAFLDWRKNNAVLFSSLGFLADSNERANTDISGLLVAYADKQNEKVTFRDAENQFHALTYADLKILQIEIAENGSYAYSQKWEYDFLVEKATSKEELDGINIVFEGKKYGEKSHA